MRTDLLEPATATADQVAGLHAVEEAARAVDEPDRPPRAVADVDGELRVARAGHRSLRWLGTDAGAPVASGWLTLPLDDNPHTGFVSVTVVPDRRRRGLGTALMRTAVGVLAEEGRRSFLVEVETGTPGAAFADALGLEEAQADRASTLRLADSDRDRVAAWAAAERPGYRLVAWTGRCPDGIVASYARAKDAMNDAPTGTMDWAGVTYDVEDVRDEEDVQRRRHRQLRVVAAVHAGSGEVAGFTELAVSDRSPARGHTGDTAVVPAHRGSGLGLWVKAELLRRLLAERPDVVEVVTRNALTNAHMWRINERLGFRTSATTVARQGQVAGAAQQL